MDTGCSPVINSAGVKPVASEMVELTHSSMNQFGPLLMILMTVNEEVFADFAHIYLIRVRSQVPDW
jgi:hypothetical protein